MAQKHNPEYIDAPMTRFGTIQGPEEDKRVVRTSAFVATKWTANNPILQLGEIGYETDTNKLKIGDGVTAWNSLAYAGGSSLPDQTGHSGEFLTTNGTDASWSAVGGLPSQTGNSGKFLTTDGTDASWSDKPLQNDSTNSGSLAILGRTNSSQNTNCVVIGESATAGAGSSSTSGAVVIGYSATTNNNAPNSITIGYKARSEASGAITIGNNVTNNVSNFIMIGELSTAYGLRVGKYHMLNSATGIITADRLGTGYDATKTQTLKNVQGVLTWVDD